MRLDLKVKIDSNAEVIIKSTLMEIEPSLDFDSIDKVLFNMCKQDFYSFTKYLKNNKIKISDRIGFFLNITDKQILFNMETLDNLELNDIIDDEKCLKAWVQWWWKRYKIRVKLMLGELPNSNFSLNRGRENAKKFTKEEIDGIKDMILYRFIENGEICGSMVLTEMLFYKVLSQYSEKFEWTVQNKLQFTNALLKEANQMSHLSGTLIFIKPSKNAYNLREYRDEGMGTVKT